MTVKEKASYIKGLLDGLNYPQDTAEGKVLYAMSELLAELAEEVVALDEAHSAVCDALDEIDDELIDLEEFVGYDEFYDEDDCCCDDDCCDDDDCCCCDCCGMPMDEDEDDEE